MTAWNALAGDDAGCRSSGENGIDGDDDIVIDRQADGARCAQNLAFRD